MLNAVRNPECISTLGLASFHFARHYFGNHGCFLFLALLRCFSSGGSPHIPMYSVYDVWKLLHTDFSIRKSAGQSLLTAHRSLSQLTTSFIGSQCQGIHPALYFALPFALFSTLIFPQSFGTLRSCELCLNNVFLQTSLKFVGYSCFYPTSFDFTRLMSLKRSFLIIFALHLLFSFQGTLSVPFRTDFRRKFPFSSNPL